ncbi:hypothetical protein DLAC_09119 [Tieghemostelium lacteum]|uniref:Uncharacterized protein n=1 Tax=Tieghemostelium lacteum TaxID=361077 RepID=A0A151Z989_TIELA|nr:hypothetical protein DLAC_09119 [Tieghemostelium lacteum]|eukprot:KYQ90493.1 hypothetical protein DLAC_09119 [Tieghemostelium lacteum]
MDLPNILIQKILEYRINLEYKLNTYYNLVYQLSLLSKSVILEILPKVRFLKRLEEVKSIKILKKLNKLTNRCDLKYTLEIPKEIVISYMENKTELSQVTKRVSHLDIIINDTDKQNEILDLFSNVDSIFFIIDDQKSIDNMCDIQFGKFKVGTQFEIKIQEEPSFRVITISDLLFNNSKFRNVDLSKVSIPDPLNIVNSNNMLKELTLYMVSIKPENLLILLKASQSLEILNISMLYLFDIPIEDIVNALNNMKNLGLLSLHYDLILFQDVVYLLNMIKCPRIYFNLQIESESDEQVYNVSINNSHIREIRINEYSSFNHDSNCKFNFLNIWNPMTSLESIDLTPNCPLSHNQSYKTKIDQLVNLTNITITTPTSSHEHPQKTINLFIKSNLPKLNTISINNSVVIDVYIKPSILLQNQYLHTLKINALEFPNLIILLECIENHKPLHTLIIKRIRTTKSDILHDLVPLIQYNQYLHTLSLGERVSIQNHDTQNEYSCILQILQNNQHLRSLTFPTSPYKKMDTTTLEDFKTLLKSDRVKSLSYIGTTFCEYPDILELCDKYSVSTLTEIKDDY